MLCMGDDSFKLIFGVSVVCLEFTSGKIVKLFDVLFVLKIQKNIVSGSCLNYDDFRQVYESNRYILS